MSIEKAIAAALEPIIDDVVALERRVAAIALTPGPAGADADPAAVAARLADDAAFVGAVRGMDGEDGADGEDGKHGAGIDAPRYVAGAVYRMGTVVVAHLGQHYRAECDTVAVPGESDHWTRLGTWGFRHRGTFDKGATYADGDLYVDGFATFCVVNGAGVMFAGRGAKGERGEAGLRGPTGAGKDGRDGATIIGAEARGFKLVLVQRAADGAIDHIEADFAPAFDALVREAVAAAVPELVATVDELRDEVASLKRTNGHRRAHA